MRARLIITLALVSFAPAMQARADDFDDDFGSLPSQSAQPAPAREVEVEAQDSAYPPLDDDPEQAPTPQADPRRKRRASLFPTVDGLVGGVHVVEASSALPGSFRVALSTGFFRKDGFITRGDHHRSASGKLSLDVTPIEHLELAAQLATLSTQNRAMEPDVTQVVGDAHLFAKTFWSVLPGLTIAGDLELALLNGVGGLGVLGGATSVGLRGSASFDLRELERDPWPLIVRTNLRYLFDNSARLARDIERDRYSSLASNAPRADEYRQLLTPAERSALQVNRVDNLGLSIGLEVPLVPHERVPVSPLLEWGFALPVNRQGFDCVSTRIGGQRDGCLADKGFGARPSTLTMGVRVQPWLPGLAALLAVDVATTGSRSFVRELAPNERYVVRLGLAYSFDTVKPAAPPPRIQRVEIPATNTRGHVVGQVVVSGTDTPVPSAIVHFEATQLSDVLTDETGSFRSAELPAGAQGMRVRADGYREALCVAVLGSTGVDVAARCELAPSAFYGNLDGHVSDNKGKPVASVHLALHGPADLTLSSGKDGGFRSEKLLEGDYQLSASAPGYFTRELSLTVARGATATPSLMLLARPAQSLVRLTPTRIVLTRAVVFTGETAIIADESQPMLGEVAELLQKHPQLAQVEVAAHLDDVAGPAAMALSEQRAQAVRDWLVGAGVDGERLTARGYGSTRPLVPNITAKNRARNRRIELLIK